MTPQEKLRLACGCHEKCGDDGDIDGPGTCKGLPGMPEPPLVEIVLVPRRAAHLAEITGAET